VILRSAYFRDFKDGPKILFWGDARALSQLANVLRASSVGTGPLSLGSFSEAVDRKTIVIRTTSPPRGMQVSGSGFEWELDSPTMVDFAEKLDVLAKSNKPGHQYLECGVTGEIVVMASCAEYPADLAPLP
jgi:hypothetical protein